MIKTTNDIVADIRSQLDEQNSASLDTSTDILPALNRAQKFAANIIARHYPDPLAEYATITTSSGRKEYDIPITAFEERLELVEVKIGQQYYPLKRVGYRELSRYETGTANTAIPRVYSVVGDSIRLPEGNTGTYNLRVWFLKEPNNLVLSQGRITSVNTASEYLLVDNLGSSLTTNSDNLYNYFNIVGRNGKVKGTFQINALDTDLEKITIKTVPDRSSIFEQSVGTSLATLTDREGNSVSISVDDYVCLAEGSCVPFMRDPLYNFLVQFAVNEMVRKLGGDFQAEKIMLDVFEEQVERAWVGRESTFRVKQSNYNWTRPRNRTFKPF